MKGSAAPGRCCGAPLRATARHGVIIELDRPDRGRAHQQADDGGLAAAGG